MYSNQSLRLLAIIQGILILLLISFCTCAIATEGGSGAYSNGADDFNAGKMPPRGVYFFNYFNYYYTDRFKDNNGHTLPVDFSSTTIGNGFRFLLVTRNKFLGADVGMYIVFSVADVQVTYFGTRQSKTGMADMSVNPIVLGWHFTDWHFGAGVDIKAPTGRYSRSDIANIGRNYWTVEPIVAVTYLNKEGYEVSAKLMYDLNTENNDTNYLSGQEFHADYTLGKKIENFNIGLGGYYYQQVTDDELNGEKVKDWKGRVFAVGPQVRYNHRTMAFILKYQRETLVQNRPEGEKFWFKFLYRF